MLDGLDRNLYMTFLPEYLRENKDFQVFLQLLISEFDITLENIEKFTDLVDPDKVPMKFIEALGSFSNYRFIENADDDFNREILMRMQTIYEQRGTDKSIVMAATHGSNAGWVGGDIFIPGYDISKDSATLIVASDSLFTHSRSRHSGTDVFADSEVYRPGVLIISLPYVNEDVIKAITEVMPAGVRFKFFLNTSFMGESNDASLGKYGELSFYKYFRVVPITDSESETEQSNTNTELDTSIQIYPENFNILKFSTPTRGKRLRSGRMIVQNSEELEYHIGASLLSVEVLKKDFIDKEDLKDSSDDSTSIIENEESLRRSTKTGILSSKSKISGKVQDINDIPDGTAEYIISPTGEKLDIKDKHGSKHLHRPIEEQEEYGIVLSREVRLTARRSMNSGMRSGLGKLSGISTGCIDSIVNIREITPKDSLYYVSDIKDLRSSDFRSPFYSPEIEVVV